jgi:hypothetical protein
VRIYMRYDAQVRWLVGSKVSLYVDQSPGTGNDAIDVTFLERGENHRGGITMPVSRRRLNRLRERRFGNCLLLVWLAIGNPNKHERVGFERISGHGGFLGVQVLRPINPAIARVASFDVRSVLRLESRSAFLN